MIRILAWLVVIPIVVIVAIWTGIKKLAKRIDHECGEVVEVMENFKLSRKPQGPRASDGSRFWGRKK